MVSSNKIKKEIVVKKDTLIFDGYVTTFLNKCKTVSEKYNLSYRHFPYLLHSYGANEEVRVQLIELADSVIDIYFKNNSKASFLRMVSDSFWNRKPFFTYNLTDQEAFHAYRVFVMQRIIDLISSDNVKINKLMSKGKGLWMYLCISRVSTPMIKRSSWNNMLKSKDGRVLGFAVKKAPPKQLVSAFESVKIKNKSILRKYNKRMRDLNMPPKIDLSVETFTRYYSLASLKNCISKDNAREILDFYSNNQEEISNNNGNNYYMKSYIKQVVDRCTSMIDDKELFSYINIDVDSLYKRSALNSIIKI